MERGGWWSAIFAANSPSLHEFVFVRIRVIRDFQQVIRESRLKLAPKSSANQGPSPEHTRPQFRNRHRRDA